MVHYGGHEGFRDIMESFGFSKHQITPPVDKKAFLTNLLTVIPNAIPFLQKLEKNLEILVSSYTINKSINMSKVWFGVLPSNVV